METATIWLSLLFLSNPGREIVTEVMSRFQENAFFSHLFSKQEL